MRNLLNFSSGHILIFCRQVKSTERNKIFKMPREPSCSKLGSELQIAFFPTFKTTILHRCRLICVSKCNLLPQVTSVIVVIRRKHSKTFLDDFSPTFFLLYFYYETETFINFKVSSGDFHFQRKNSNFHPFTMLTINRGRKKSSLIHLSNSLKWPSSRSRFSSFDNNTKKSKINWCGYFSYHEMKIEIPNNTILFSGADFICFSFLTRWKRIKWSKLFVRRCLKGFSNRWFGFHIWTLSFCYIVWTQNQRNSNLFVISVQRVLCKYTSRRRMKNLYLYCIIFLHCFKTFPEILRIVKKLCFCCYCSWMNLLNLLNHLCNKRTTTKNIPKKMWQNSEKRFFWEPQKNRILRLFFRLV